MFADYAHADDHITNALQEDLTRVVKHIGSAAQKKVMCFLTHGDAYLPLLLQAGFDNIVAVAERVDVLEEFRDAYAGDARVAFVLDSDGEYFAQHEVAFDVLFFSNPHHGEEIMPYEEKALTALKPGGVVYFFELRPLGTVGKVWVMLDTLFAKIGSLVGLVKVRRTVEEGSPQIQGVDDMQLLRRLKRNHCRPVFVEYSRFPATWLFHLLRNLVRYPAFFRIIAAKDA